MKREQEIETRFNKVIDGKEYSWKFDMNEFSEGDIIVRIKNKDELADFMSILIRQNNVIHKDIFNLYNDIISAYKKLIGSVDDVGLRCLKKIANNSDIVRYSFIGIFDVNGSASENKYIICELDKIKF